MRTAKPASNLRIYVAIAGFLVVFWGFVGMAVLRAFA